LFFNYLNAISDYIFKKSEQLMRSRFGYIKASLLCALLVILSSTPKYGSFHFSTGFHTSEKAVQDTATCQTLQKQISNPFTILPQANGFHQDKMQFRLFMPVMGHLLHLDVNGLIVLQQILGIFLFLILLLLIKKITGDDVQALLFATGSAFIYFGKACFIDLWPWFDGTCYLLILMAMFWRSPLLIWLFVFAASWIDERGLVATGYVFIWWLIQSQKDEKENISFKKLIILNTRSLAVVLAWVSYFALRTYLHKSYHFQTYTENIFGKDSAYQHTMSIAHFGLFTGIIWYWLFILAATIVLLWRKSFLPLILLYGVIGASTVSALLVYDVTRSAAYIFPAAIIGFYLIQKPKNENPDNYERNMRNFLLLITMLCLLTPAFNVLGLVRFNLKPIFYNFISS